MGGTKASPPERSLLEEAIAAAGGPEKFLELWRCLPADDRKRFGFEWRNVARPKQLPPPGRWRTWMVRAGRGWGKTRVGAEFIRTEVEAGRARRIALVARTSADARDVIVEGESGILAISPPWCRPNYEPSKRRLTWPNGARATLFSADEPDLLRGPQHDTAWCDELAAWVRLQDAWDNLQFGLRLGADPRCVVTTTPRGLRFLRELEAERTTVVTRGSTYENQENLAPAFLQKIRDKYEGTRLGRQEIGAEILDDNPNALWKLKDIELARITMETFLGDRKANVTRIVVAVDPAVSTNPHSNETGIVVCAVGWCWCRHGQKELHGYVLEDLSGIYTPREWALAVAHAYQHWRADRVIAERNQGGDLVAANLSAHDESKNLPLKTMHVKEGKRLRAEPVAGIYEQFKCHHVGGHPALEDQMTQWDPQDASQSESPDRLDAMVHGVTELMLEDDTVEYIPRGKPILPRRR